MTAPISVKVALGLETESAKSNLAAFSNEFKLTLTGLGGKAEDIRFFAEMAKAIDAGKVSLSDYDAKTQALLTTFRKGRDIAAARDFLGVPAHAQVQAAIDKTRAAYEALKASGQLTSAELSQAALRTRDKIRELEASITVAKQEVADLDQEMAKGDTVREKFIGFAKQAAAALGLIKLADMVKDTAVLAARYETMGVAMGVAGNNAGYTSEQMEAVTRQLEKQGISMLQSRDAVIQLATAQIDLAKATELGRAAQDLAVVGNTNSSDAMQRMIHGIKSAEVEVLRTLGLNVSFEESYKKLATQLGINTAELTEQQKVQARTNEVLTQAARYQGIYEESMTTSGKAMGSLTRYWEDLQIKLGNSLLPTTAEGVFALTDGLKAANAELDKMADAGQVAAAGGGLADAFKVMVQTLSVLALEIKFVFVGVGREIGGIAAQLVALAKLDFKGFREIGEQMVADAKAARIENDALIERIMTADKLSAAASANRKKEAEEKRLALAAEKAAAEQAAQAVREQTKRQEELSKILKETGQDYEALTTGIGKGTSDAIKHVDTLAASSADLARAIEGGLVYALKQVKNEGDLSAVTEKMRDLGITGERAGLAIQDAMRQARQRIEDLMPGVQSTEEAYRKLGIASEESLRKAATEAKAAYDVIASSGEKIEIVGAAWAKYAEAAIAANGGVADSTITAEAAMRGYTVVVDEAGRAHVAVMQKAKDSTKDLAREQDALHLAIAQANDDLARQILAQDNVIGSMQGSIDGFHAHLAVLNAQATAAATAYNQAFYEQNKDIWERLTEIVNKEMSLQANSVLVGEGAMAAYNSAMESTATELRKQVDAVDSYINALTATSAPSASLIADAERASQSMDYLGEQDLAPLRAAIADAQRRMEDLRDAAQSTLGDIQDEWDELNNNLDEIERRRAEKRKAEIEAQLAVAKAAEDREAIADLERALSLLKQITTARIADAKEQERANRTAAGSARSSTGDRTGGMSTGSTSTGSTVNINLHGLITSSPAEIARLLKPEIDKLTRLSA